MPEPRTRRDTREPRDDIRNRISRELLVRSGIVYDAAPSQVAQLVSLAKDVSFPAGSELQRRGERCRSFLVITEGEVELGDTADCADAKLADPTAADGAITATGHRVLGRGEAVGLVDALLDRPRSRTAMAQVAVRALSIDLAAFLDFLENNFELTLGLMARLASTVHEQLLRAAASLQPEIAAHSSTHMLAWSSAHMPAHVSCAEMASMSMTLASAELDNPLQGCHVDTETTIGRLLVMRHLGPFAAASVQAQVSLSEDARVHRLEDGQMLFRAGDPGDVLWMVAGGGVALSAVDVHGDGTPSFHCGPGDLVEHHAALAGGPRRFTAFAVGDTVLLGIDREALLDRMDEHFDLTRSLLGFLGAEQERLAQLGSRALRLV
jgi:CRP-like cAMP-binding protein